jgi:hypothetical protein
LTIALERRCLALTAWMPSPADPVSTLIRWEFDVLHHVVGLQVRDLERMDTPERDERFRHTHTINSQAGGRREGQHMHGSEGAISRGFVFHAKVVRVTVRLPWVKSSLGPLQIQWRSASCFGWHARHQGQHTQCVCSDA